MTEPIKYEDHPKAKPGDPCLLCGNAAAQPAIDHCHTHGWVRGALCSSCNGAMAFIDRRIRPRGSAVRIEALLAHAQRCPECTTVTVADLGPTRSWNRGVEYRAERATSPTASVGFRLPADLHAWLVAQAESAHRSLNSEIVYRLEGERATAEAHGESS
ncbi:endonuclease domain-containing protein [Streptomyces sp. NPDC001401]|uniref:endonuclease domain-containing protein n=1 Tax=Streptomyces sp. NPDC001401 TaxID=3364570 RepID=UPI0036C01105